MPWRTFHRNRRDPALGSNHVVLIREREYGQEWIRTTEGKSQQIYSLPFGQ